MQVQSKFGQYALRQVTWKSGNHKIDRDLECHKCDTLNKKSFIWQYWSTGSFFYWSSEPLILKINYKCENDPSISFEAPSDDWWLFSDCLLWVNIFQNFDLLVISLFFSWRSRSDLDSFYSIRFLEWSGERAFFFSVTFVD